LPSNEHEVSKTLKKPRLTYDIIHAYYFMGHMRLFNLFTNVGYHDSNGGEITYPIEIPITFPTYYSINKNVQHIETNFINDLASR